MGIRVAGILRKNDMPDQPTPKSLSETAAQLRAQLADMVHRSLLQIGDMRHIEEEMAKLTERISKLTPPSESPQAEK